VATDDRNVEPNRAQVTLADPIDCPFSLELLTRHFGFGGMPLTPDEDARCVDARKHRAGRVLNRTVVACPPARVTFPSEWRPAYAVRAHHHAELIVDRRRVHIEAVSQELAGPGGTNTEVRVYVDGILHGRSISLGRLGGTVTTFPVVAVVGPDLVMTVQPVVWTRLDELIVEVQQPYSSP
jgi:hypothetical protein